MRARALLLTEPTSEMTMSRRGMRMASTPGKGADTMLALPAPRHQRSSSPESKQAKTHRRDAISSNQTSALFPDTRALKTWLHIFPATPLQQAIKPLHRVNKAQQADQTLFVALGTTTASSRAEQDGCPGKQMPLAEKRLPASPAPL